VSWAATVNPLVLAIDIGSTAPRGDAYDASRAAGWSTRTRTGAWPCSWIRRIHATSTFTKRGGTWTGRSEAWRPTRTVAPADAQAEQHPVHTPGLALHAGQRQPTL